MIFSVAIVQDIYQDKQNRYGDYCRHGSIISFPVASELLAKIKTRRRVLYIIPMQPDLILFRLSAIAL
jgi:hypothetical protein